MDTRTKISHRLDHLREPGNLLLARGWFDVLTAEQCRNLERAKPEDAQLFVLVYRESPERPSPLGSYDRAQMVAALSCVDRVLVCGMEQADSIAERLRPEVELDVDALQTRDVVRDVLELDRRN